MKKPVIVIFLIIFLSSCMTKIKFGEPPELLENDLIIESGIKTYLNEKNEELEMRYIITRPDIERETSQDLILYLHGLGGTELDWVETDSFGPGFYSIVQSNSNYKNYYTLSISFGRAFVFLDGLPKPYCIDLETLLINEIIPYFKTELNLTGDTYLIGHSMGGYNCLFLALRHPDIFKAAVTLSPYVGPISPFTDEFVQNGRELGAPELNIWLMKKLLTDTFTTEDRWYAYNPLKLAEGPGPFPYIIFSTTEHDLPGFSDSIIQFRDNLEQSNAEYYFCEGQGNHFAVCAILFTEFLDKIN